MSNSFKRGLTSPTSLPGFNINFLKLELFSVPRAAKNSMTSAITEDFPGGKWMTNWPCWSSMNRALWDNVSGAFADTRESEQIGFTQDYSKFIPASAAGGTLGGAIVGTQPGYTRIVIPFGRIFEGVFQQGLQKVFPNSLTCFDDSCELEKLKSATPTYVVRLKVSEFQVLENPLNHLNLKAIVECKALSSWQNRASGLHI